MQFDPENPVIQLCAAGMQKEGEGKPLEAKQLFCEAWQKAISAFEQFTAAHYVARQQNTVEDKLRWDEKCLAIALTIEDETMKTNYPSLYLNVAKGFEDIGDTESAGKNYSMALSYTKYLPDDGYGNMIKAGINKGLQRVR